MQSMTRRSCATRSVCRQTREHRATRPRRYERTDRYTIGVLWAEAFGRSPADDGRLDEAPMQMGPRTVHPMQSVHLRNPPHGHQCNSTEVVDCKYIYNLDVSSLGALATRDGTYYVYVNIGGNLANPAVFDLR